MSLYEAADGLLGTHVTWNDMESALQKVYGTNATFGVNRKVTDIGEMKGFMSKIALLEADWTIKDENEELPPRLVVKIASELSLYGMSQLVGSSQWDIDKMKAMTSVVKDCHNREVGMYKIVGREAPDCPVIKVLAMEDFGDSKDSLKAYIISEYLHDLEHIGMHNNLLIPEVLPVVDGIAAFSAMGQKMTESEKNATIGEVYIEEAIKYFYGENSPDDMRKNLVEVLGVAYEEKIEEAMDIFDSICSSTEIQKNYSKASAFLGHSPVLQHSDIWPSNMLFSRDPTSRLLELQAIIDFQTASFSSPGLDVACLLVTCLSKTDRRTHKDEVLGRYYSKFEESLNGLPLPYTRDQLQLSYDLCFPAAVILMLPFMLSLSMKVGDIIPEESADKMIGLIEDLVAVHESNLKNFPKFFNA